MWWKLLYLRLSHSSLYSAHMNKVYGHNTVISVELSVTTGNFKRHNLRMDPDWIPWVGWIYKSTNLKCEMVCGKSSKKTFSRGSNEVYIGVWLSILVS